MGHLAQVLLDPEGASYYQRTHLPRSIPGFAKVPLLPVVLLVALVGSAVGGLMLLTYHSGTSAEMSLR